VKTGNILTTKIVVHAIVGGNLASCIREALWLAVDKWENVELTHSEKVYRINVNDLILCAKEIKKN